MLIGISGASCSGKTTLAHEIARLLGAATLHLDRHFIEDAERPIVNGHPSFEQPHQYDAMALLDEAVEACVGTRFVVVEGFLLFTYPGFTTVCDRMVHLDVPHDTLAARRMERAAAKAGLMDVKGGRLKAADDGWARHGRDEWLRYGEAQARIPGVRVVRPGIDHPATQAEIARLLVREWTDIMCEAA